MIRILLLFILVCLLIRLGWWLTWKVDDFVKGHPVQRRPGRTVSRAEVPAAIEAPEPRSEFLDGLDALLWLTSHDDVLARLPDSIREEFEPANQPCPNVRSRVHQWVAHQTWTDGFSGTRGVRCWRCPCGAHTKNAERVMLDQASRRYGEIKVSHPEY